MKLGTTLTTIGMFVILGILWMEAGHSGWVIAIMGIGGWIINILTKGHSCEP